MACRRRPAPVVLHVLHSISPGGTERVLARLIHALSADSDQPNGGSRHVVCTLRKLGTLAEEFPPDVELICLHQSGRNPWLFRKLAAVIRQVQPDVVHARNWGTWTDAALSSAMCPGVRLVLGFHGLQDAVTFSAAQRRRAWLLGMRRREVATVSSAAREMLVASLGLRPERIRVIPNGIDARQFAPADAAARAACRSRFRFGPDDFVVGSTGAFKPIKRHGVMLEAFARLVNSCPNAKLLLSGYGREQQSIESRAAALGLADRVIFAGWLPNVTDALHAMDVYASSSAAEGMSNSVLEALGCGLPCAVTDVSDHRAIFAGVDPGLVVPVEDGAALGDALIRLAQQPQQRARIGQLSRRLILEQFTFERTVEGYRRLYTDVTEQIERADQASAGWAMV